MSKRLTAAQVILASLSPGVMLLQCLEDPWLRGSLGADAIIRTENLRRYLVRRRWMRFGQAIKAANRLSGRR